MQGMQGECLIYAPSRTKYSTVPQISEISYLNGQKNAISFDTAAFGECTSLLSARSHRQSPDA